MLVYRICRLEEFEQIIGDDNFSNIGRTFTLDDTVSLNSHEYEEVGNYLHFFKELSSIIFLADLKDHYLCYYELPEDLLEQYKGTGYYSDPIYWMNTNKLEEYAIPSRLLKREFIIGIDRIKYGIDIDDYIDDPSFHNYIEMVYYQGKDKKLVKVSKEDSV